ncbi:MAG TPA: FAD-linked oxidase C-terminal domain-containing protein [Solirubrobacteraceae bacterium]|nr:FAD-linked oxidase C-terminal domain-containing protein [Solirubrobacteraceae bacterium]
MESLARELARIVGPEHVLTGPASAPYEHDATLARGLRGRADAVVRPADPEQVAEVLRWSYAHGVPIVPRGGGTGLAGGAVPIDGGIVCALERLTRVRELEPGLWRMHVEAGLRTREVQRLARENGLSFPPDPGAAESSQIGGNLATNAGGPHAFKHGPTGAWVTGLEAAIAPGELISLGGPQRRDVAGYDLKSLLVGSEGTLGIITAVRLRLLPAPEARRALLAFHRDLPTGCEALLAVLASGLEPAALDFIDAAALEILATGKPEGSPRAPAGAGFALLIDLEGSHPEVARERAELEGVLAPDALELRDLEGPAAWRWREGFGIAVAALRGGKAGEDVVVPVEHLREALEEIAKIAAAHGLPACAWGHAGDGNIHANLLIDPASPSEREAAARASEEIFALATRLGGSVSGEHGVGLLKRGWLARQWPAAAIDLHEAIRRTLDPKGLLNPGKKLPRG